MFRRIRLWLSTLCAGIAAFFGYLMMKVHPDSMEDIALRYAQQFAEDDFDPQDVVDELDEDE